LDVKANNTRRTGEKFNFGVQVRPNWSDVECPEKKDITHLWNEAIQNELAHRHDYETSENRGCGAKLLNCYQSIQVHFYVKLIMISEESITCCLWAHD